MGDLILASASPRRAELLAAMGLEFKVFPADIDESVSQASPREAVMLLAKNKALHVLQHRQGCVVLGADTLVCIDNELLGKPRDEMEAVSMLKKLSGRWHTVYTGVCLAEKEQVLVDSCETKVLFDALTDAEIEAYVLSREPFDKAGAYAIQGMAAQFVKEICGNYANVMGLPTCMLRTMLKQLKEKL